MKTILQAVDDGDNILLTGGAGVGKTWNTNIITDHLLKQGKKFAVCALTGLASQHLNFGMTLHRFLGIGGATSLSEARDLLDRENFIEQIEAIGHVSTIFIDEVSMLRSDLIELVDWCLKEARARYNIKKAIVMDTKEHQVFGGYQVIFIGDFCQLPPVVTKGEIVPFRWSFQHPIFTEAKFRIYNLTEVKRTSDLAFATTLNKIRIGYFDKECLSMISSRENKPLNGTATVLMSRNHGVQDYNQRKLNDHAGEQMFFKGFFQVREEVKERGEKAIKALYAAALKEAPLDKDILLKTGCKVMLLANNPEMGYSNGSQGTFLGTKQFDEYSNEFTNNKGLEFYLDFKYFGECLHVLLDSGEDVIVPRKAYKIFGNDFDDKGKRLADITFNQFPVTLGYAISIHKSQGMSLEKVIVDCQNIFADGQFYVGLSRARSLEGLSILNFDSRYIKADPWAVDFYLRIGELGNGNYYTHK